MVVSSLKYQAKRRGRPVKEKITFDRGTPEQQAKRNFLLSFIVSQQKVSSVVSLKALSGSFLHQLFCLGHIDKKQLQIGLICQKIFALASRSMGVHTKLNSISGRLGIIQAYTKDYFENKNIEEKWKKLRRVIFKIKQESQLKNEIINLILFDQRQHYDLNPFVSSRFVNSLQSVLDEMGKMINKLKDKKT